MNPSFVSTYADILERMASFIKARPTAPSVDQQTLRYNIESSLREIVNYRDWKCLKKIWRVQLAALRKTGTVTYDSTTMIVELTGSTFPTDAKDWTLRIGGGNVNCEIDSYIDPTHVLLKSPLIPNASIAVATSYTMGKTWYELPPEFIASWSPAEKNARFTGKYIPFEEWYLFDKYCNMAGIAHLWSIGPVPNKYNAIALYVYPWPQADEEYDLLMKIRPRSMIITGKESWASSGKVSVSLNGTTVSGSFTYSGTTPVYQTSFRELMIGSIIRFSADGTALPTDTNGTNPYVFQAVITDVDETAQTLTLDTPVTRAFSAVKYVVADPLTLESLLYDAFLRCCEKNLASAMDTKDALKVERQFLSAIQRAKYQDASVKQRQMVGESGRYLTRLADMKSRPWIAPNI